VRVALVHDWLTGLRGGEKVLHEVAGLFPDAELYTLIHVPRSTTERIESLHVHASPLSRLPGAARHYRKLLPLFPWAIERFRLERYDLVVSISHSFAKGVRVVPPAVHVCYCLTPIRYAWDHADTYLGRGARRLLAAPLLAYLRRWDVRTSSPERLTRCVTLSHYIAQRIRRAWGRDSFVVYPPVEVERFRPAADGPDPYYLLVGGFVPYKAEGLAIEAFARLGSRLLIAGDGPTRGRLQASAPPNVEFLGRVSDARLEQLYARCRALIYPQEEDFGIIAVEAQAAGRPVIALGRGGATETVIPHAAAGGRAPTGVWFPEPTPEALCAAVREFERVAGDFDPKAIRAHAECFSPEAFRRGLQAEIRSALG
jgi:glycosyltransferase involved in cell wall biosynthesis